MVSELCPILGYEQVGRGGGRGSVEGKEGSLSPERPRLR